MIADSILDLIGKTPHLRLSVLFPNAEVFMKLERQNPGGSIKDRIALGMVLDAREKGLLKEDTVIIEPTSGNTGIGLAMVAARMGYRLIIVMPDSASEERIRLMLALGAEVILTPRAKGMSGAIEKARELSASFPGSWIPFQFSNPANPETHYKTTAKEILSDFPQLDCLVTGVGSGGHITGIGRKLREKIPDIEIIAVEPEDSPVLSGGKPGPHAIQGIGAGFIPENLDRSLLARVVTVSGKDAFRMGQLLAEKEGVLGGISTGASLFAVSKILEEKSCGKILTINYDTAERYFSVDGYLPIV